MKLPDAEELCEQLAAELKPRIGPKSAMVGLYTAAHGSPSGCTRCSA